MTTVVGKIDRHVEFLDVVPDFNATILQTLSRGWGTMCNHPKMQSGTPEVEVTELLRKGMREIVNQRASRQAMMVVLPGTESLSRSELLRPDGRTDIPICFPDIVEACLDHEPHAIIECKRVAGGDSSLCRLYVVEGMDRFVSGKYASSHAIAFMCGYLQSDNVDMAVVGINRYLRGKGRATERLRSSTILREKWARTSHHSRPKDLNDIDVHHAFCEFNASP